MQIPHAWAHSAFSGSVVPEFCGLLVCMSEGMHGSCAGEIVPQALCTRFGLAIGSYSAWFVQLLIYACWIIAWPISKILDYVLGDQHSVSFGMSSAQSPFNIMCVLQHAIPLHGHNWCTSPSMLHKMMLSLSALHLESAQREPPC